MWSITAMTFSQRLIHGLCSSNIVLSCSLVFYTLFGHHEFFMIVSSDSSSHLKRLLGMINCVKLSGCIQRLIQNYLLTYYQKEWDDHTKTILGLIFQRIISLMLTARTIRISISFLRVNVHSYAWNSPLLYLGIVFVHTRALIPW